MPQCPICLFSRISGLLSIRPRSPLCDYVVLLSEFFVMAVLFFIAGYLAPPSLAKNGPARFARSRLYRLGIPFVFGLCVMCPVMTYVRDLAKGKAMAGYFSYWLLKYFHGKMYAGYLWFLSTLLIIMLLYCCACAASPRLKAYLQAPPDGGSSRLLRPAGLLAMGMVHRAVRLCHKPAGAGCLLGAPRAKRHYYFSAHAAARVYRLFSLGHSGMQG